MTLKPTRYEYEPPLRIHGTPIEVETKIDVVQQGGQWTATMTSKTIPSGSAGEAQSRLREECLRIAALLGGKS